MGYVIVTLLALVLGYSVGAGSVLRDVRSGRISPDDGCAALRQGVRRAQRLHCL